MKNLISASLMRLFGIIAIVAITGFSMTACGGNDSLNGTWTAGNMEWTFKNGSYELKENGKLDEKGTYKTKASSRDTSLSKGIMELTPTHINGENWYISSPGDLEEKWYSKDDLKKQGIGDEHINTIFAVDEKEYEVDGNTLTLNGTNYTKQGGNTQGGSGSGSTQGGSAPSASGNLTITGLPNKQYAVYLFNSGVDMSTIVAISQGIKGSHMCIGTGLRQKENVFIMANFPVLTPLTVTGSHPVVLHDFDGDPMFWHATVNFTDGGATVSFSSFTAVTGSITDGDGNWATASDSIFGSDDYFNAITYGNNRFVTVGHGRDGLLAAYSDNGINWTAVRIDEILNVDAINDIVYGNGRFYASTDGGVILHSVNGENWEMIQGADTAFGITEISGIAYGNNRFVTIGQRGMMAYSNDGLNWTAIPHGTDNTTTTTFGTSFIRAVTWGGDKFVAVSNDGKIAYSTNGINWTAVSNTTFDESNIISIVYGNGRFVAGGASGKIAYSDNGINWTAGSVSSIDNSRVNAIAYGNGMFFLGGRMLTHVTGLLAYSGNGINWTEFMDYFSAFGVYNDIRGITYGNGMFVAVCDGGRIAYWQP